MKSSTKILITVAALLLVFLIVVIIYFSFFKVNCRYNNMEDYSQQILLMEEQVRNGGSWDFERAHNLANEAIECFPDNYRGYLLSTAIYIEQGNLDNAHEQILKSLERMDSSAEVYSYLALILVKKSRLILNSQGEIPEERQDEYKEIRQKALDAYIKCSTLEPEESMHWYNLGSFYFEEEELEKAIEAFNKALEIDPYFWSVKYALAGVYFNQEKYEQSLSLYKECLMDNPYQREAYAGIAACYSAMGNEAEANYYYAQLGYVEFITAQENQEYYLQEAIKLMDSIPRNGYNSEKWEFYITLLFQLGDYDKAMEEIQKGKQRFPNNAEYWVSEARIYLEQDNLDRAQEIIQRAILRFPLEDRPYTILAIIYDKKGETDKAIENYEKALRYNPGDVVSREKLATLYRQAGNMDYANFHQSVVYYYKGSLEQALISMEKAEEYPYASYKIHYIALFSYEAGQIEDAIEGINSAISVDPSNGWRYLDKARILTAKGEEGKREGCQILREYLSKYVTNSALRSAINAYMESCP